MKEIDSKMLNEVRNNPIAQVLFGAMGITDKELNKLDEMIEQDENSVTHEHFKDVYDKHCSLVNQGVDIVKQLTGSDLFTAKSLFITRNDKICYLLERMN